MLSAEDNEKLTRTGPGTPMGRVLRRYWQPLALADELRQDRPAPTERIPPCSTGRTMISTHRRSSQLLIGYYEARSGRDRTFLAASRAELQLYPPPALYPCPGIGTPESAS